MSKGHYNGGSTLVGSGKVSKAKGRRGGIDTPGAALRERRKEKANEARKKLAAKIRSNEKLVREFGKGLVAEKGRKLFNKLTMEKQIRNSPLAGKLHAALLAKNHDDEA